MLVAVPIRVITDDPKLNQIFNRLPEDVQSYFIHASDNFQSQTIIPLLESSDADFQMKFIESAGHLGNYFMQIGEFLTEKQKMHPNILGDIIEFNIGSFEAIKDVVENLPNDVLIGIANTLEILLNYMMMTNNPKMIEEISKPEYEPALGSYLYLLLSISALISIFKYENEHYKKKINTLLQYCNYYAKELEDYVETMEIENSPEDMQRLEKIKNV